MKDELIRRRDLPVGVLSSGHRRNRQTGSAVDLHILTIICGLWSQIAPEDVVTAGFLAMC